MDHNRITAAAGEGETIGIPAEFNSSVDLGESAVSTVCFSSPGSRLAASAPFGLSPRAYLEVSGSLLLVAVGDVPPASNAEFSQLTNVAMQN